MVWSDVLGIAAVTPRWSVEHVRARGVPRAAWSTTLRALHPMRFWNALRLHHPVHPVQLAVGTIVVGASLWALAAAANVGAYIAATRIAPARQGWRRAPIDMQTLIGIAFEPLTGLPDWGSFHGWWQDPVLYGGAGLVVGFCMSLLIARSVRRPRIRMTHVVRAATLSLAPLAIYLLLQGIDAARLALALAIEPAPRRGGPTPSLAHRVLAWRAGYLRWLWWDRRIFTVLVIGAWMAWFWWCALRVGFQAPRAWPVVVAGAILGGLLGFVGAFLADPFALDPFYR